MHGPHVIGCAGRGGGARRLGAPGANLSKGEWPPEVKAGVAAVAKAAVEATKDLPAQWYYYGVDEPTGDNTYAIQDYQAWHDGGAPTYATFYVPSFLEKASPISTAPCFVVGPRQQRAQTRRRPARPARRPARSSGGTGPARYVNPFPQEGFMFHNRYGAGLLFWKTGAQGARPPGPSAARMRTSSTTSTAAAPTPPSPRSRCTAYPHLLKPDDWSTYQGAIPTIAWESLREGVDDYLLPVHADTAHQAGAGEQVGGDRATPPPTAQTDLEALVNSVPWANPMGGVAFETKRLQQVRRLVADRIVALQAALTGKALAPGQAATQQLTLRVQTTDVAARPALPTLSVPAAPSRSDRGWHSR